MKGTQIREPRPLQPMKRSLALLVVIGLMLTSSAAQAGTATGGEDVNPSDDVPFTVEERTTPSQDGKTWTLSVALDQEALDNGTTLAITTQICLNNGVCDPPTPQEATVSEDGRTYTMDLEPPTDHSYVNWRVKATTMTIPRKTSLRVTGTRRGRVATTATVHTAVFTPTGTDATSRHQVRAKGSFPHPA